MRNFFVGSINKIYHVVNGSALSACGGDVQIVKCTFMNNTVNSEKALGAAVYMLDMGSQTALTNCILWGNWGGKSLGLFSFENQIIHSSGPGAGATYSLPLISTSCVQGDGGAIYTGTGNIYTDPLFDVGVGNPDMGAYEYW